MKKLVVILAVSVLVAGVWYASNRRSQAALPKSDTSEKFISQVEIRDIEYSIQVSGDVQPETQLDVKAEVGGRVKKLYIKPGDEVKAGDLLVEIDERDIMTERDSSVVEIEGAKLAVDNMEKNFARALELFEQKLISKEAYDNLDSQLAISRNTLTRAERKLQLVDDKLSKTKINAPGDGTVLTVPIVEGQVIIAAASVNNGTTLMTIANLSKLIVETHVNQVDVAKLAGNQEVKLTAESIKDEEMGAEVFFIAPVASIKNSVKGFSVRAVIDKPSPRLRPGMTVQITIPIANAQDVVAVPVGAVFKGEGNSRVVYVRDGERTERRSVKVGVSNTEFAQILQGVREGERVLLTEPERGPGKRPERGA
jgi:RND family efflux transporter MFP subunit